MPVRIGGKRVMDKPNDLVSAKKVMLWMSNNLTKFYDVADVIMEFDKEVSSGRLDSDPIPLPTIKPGDKVRITDAMASHYIGKEDTVTQISGSSPFSARLKESPGDWPFSSLEAVE